MLLFHVPGGAESRGRVAAGVISERLLLCALSGRRGVARCDGQEPRQPSSKANSTASLSSPALCLFCPLQAPPESCWQPAAWGCAHALQTAWQVLLCVCLCCCPETAALCSAGLVRVLVPAKIPWMCMQLSQACCCRELWSRNLQDCSQRCCFPLPGSQELHRNRMCTLCWEKLIRTSLLV